MILTSIKRKFQIIYKKLYIKINNLVKKEKNTKQNIDTKYYYIIGRKMYLSKY